MPQALWHRGSARAITDGVRRISDLPDAEAAAELARCCASSRWVERMLSQRPFKDSDEVFESAERIWRDVTPADGASEEELKLIRLRLEKLLTL
ncbi:MAG: 2-oxo-4-hydroxy-4-carboxy-5-ureidoimidazoline decarboxylase [Gemmatimonadales bacterium]